MTVLKHCLWKSFNHFDVQYELLQNTRITKLYLKILIENIIFHSDNYENQQEKMNNNNMVKCTCLDMRNN